MYQTISQKKSSVDDLCRDRHCEDISDRLRRQETEEKGKQETCGILYLKYCIDNYHLMSRLGIEYEL